MSIYTWENMLIPRLSGAVTAVIQEEIKVVIDDFCRQSTAWRDMIYGLNVTSGDREITPQVGDGSQTTVAGILRVYYNNRQLTQYSHTPWETQTDVPTGYGTKSGNPAVIVLSTIPSQDLNNALNVWAYLTPTDPEVFVPDVLLNEYWEYVYDGVLGRMYSHPNKPYSNSQLSVYHLKKYRQGIMEARDLGNRGFIGNAQNWAFPRFGR